MLLAIGQQAWPTVSAIWNICSNETLAISIATLAQCHKPLCKRCYHINWIIMDRKHELLDLWGIPSFVLGRLDEGAEIKLPLTSHHGTSFVPSNSTQHTTVQMLSKNIMSTLTHLCFLKQQTTLPHLPIAGGTDGKSHKHFVVYQSTFPKIIYQTLLHTKLWIRCTHRRGRTCTVGLHKYNFTVGPIGLVAHVCKDIDGASLLGNLSGTQVCIISFNQRLWNAW